MTGKSHVIVNTALAYAMFGSAEIAVVAAICAKLPDQMEILMPGVPHRKVTHVMVVWFAAAIFFGLGLLYPWLPFFSWEGGDAVRLALFAISLGGLLHVVADFFSISGVPILTFGKGFGLKWYTTGTLSELLALFGAVAVAAAVYALRNGCAQVPSLLQNVHI